MTEKKFKGLDRDLYTGKKIGRIDWAQRAEDNRRAGLHLAALYCDKEADPRAFDYDFWDDYDYDTGLVR